ncbi:DUF3501 family protein [Engelhardtia mirabilis]|uniref:DUF3501 family protein n=1 Tax=Engelhardtia mirabilis TaxID=2528011 RepID=UPI00119EC8E5
MSRVTTDQIMDLERYEAARPALAERVRFEKQRRRIHVGEHLTFLFENAETIRYQVQEMLRIEKRTDAASIQHEIDTYNELLGSAGEIGCTLLIEIEEPAERDRKLREWTELPAHVWVEVDDGRRVAGTFDPRQISDGRLSSVHYVKFVVGDGAPVAVGCSLPGIDARTELSVDQRQALMADLSAAAKG